MTLKKEIWVIRRPIRMLFWEEYWEKVRKKNLITELKKNRSESGCP